MKNQAKVEAVLNNAELSKSRRMIELYTLGLGMKEIATLLSAKEGKEVRYNFVYNVVSNHCNITGTPLTTTKKTGKRDQIIELHNQGKTAKEISIELKTHVTYVHTTIKAFKDSQAQGQTEQADVQAEAQ